MRLPAIGSTFHGYAIDAELGSGGFSTVFRAIDLSSQAIVALKVLRPDEGHNYSARRLRRFHREAAVLEKLDSPHIVRLLSSGTAPDGLLYLVFELVGGVDLTMWLAAGPMPPELVRTILGQQLEALAAAHGAGVLHRDIKPGNIRVWNDHGVHSKLLDFGIARPLALSGPALTATGELVGTVRFLAPEQLRGEEPTPASDLYSLGLVAFEMVTGRRSDTERMARGALRIEQQELGDLVLRRAINRMLRDDPSERWPSATAARRALDQAPSDVSRSTIRELPPEPASNWRFAAIGGLLAAVLAAVGVWYASAGEHDTAPTPAAVPQAVLSTPPPRVVPPQPAPEPEPEPEPKPEPEPEALTGCGVDPPFVGRGRLRGLDGMTAREFVAHIPRSYDSSFRHPIVIVLHQWGDDAGVFLDATRLSQLAEAERFVVIAPSDGAFYPWQDPGDVDDVRWALELAKSELCIDPQRVYGLGNGDGGMLAERMPCSMDVAAIATTAFRSRPGQIECDWEETQPVPYLIVSATKDGYNPIEGGMGCSEDVKISLAEKEEIWAKRNGCPGRWTKRKIGKSECRDFTGCETALHSCRPDGGHNWPHALPRASDMSNCDGKPADFPYRDTIWEFFKAHSRTTP